jgi:hypothetical protein
MFKMTCLVDPRRKVGTPRKLGPGSPQKLVLAQRYRLQEGAEEGQTRPGDGGEQLEEEALGGVDVADTGVRK